MATEQTIKTNKKEIEQGFRKTIYEKLSLALDDYKNGMDENKFQATLKKASKMLSKEVAKEILKKDSNKKKTKKKANKKGK